MLYKDRQLPELFYIKNRHNDDDDFVDYEKTILSRNLSPYMYENNIMNGFLTRLQPLVASLFDRMNVIKNFKNYIVDKDWYK